MTSDPAIRVSRCRLRSSPGPSGATAIEPANAARALVIGCGALARELLEVTDPGAGPRRRLPVARPPQPPRRDPRRGPRPDRDGPPRRLRADLHRLRRLRDGRPARAGAGRGRRRAPAGRPLLRGLRRVGRVRRAGRRRAGHVLADRLPRPQLRAARHPRARDRSSSGAPGDVLRPLHPGRVPVPDRGPGPARAGRAGPPSGSGLAFEHRPTTVANLAAPILAFAARAGATIAPNRRSAPRGAH